MSGNEPKLTPTRQTTTMSFKQAAKWAKDQQKLPDQQQSIFIDSKGNQVYFMNK